MKMAQSTTTPAPRENIVILGGSYSGVSADHYLLEHVVPELLNKAPYQVVLDDSTTSHPFILSVIPVLCANIKRDLLLRSGKEESSVGEDRVFMEDTRETQLVPIGKSEGVGAAMGYRLPSFMVWLIKGRDYWLWTTGGLWSGKQWAKES